MRNKIGISLVLILLVGLFATAFVPRPPADEYAFGYRTTQTLTYDIDGIDVTLSKTLTICELGMDSTSTTINLDAASGNIVGDRVVFIVTASGTDTEDTLTWGTGFTAPDGTVDSTKVKVFEFIYDGTAFKGVSTPFQLSWFYEREAVFRCYEDLELLAATASKHATDKLFNNPREGGSQGPFWA